MLIFTRKIVWLCLAYSLLFGQLACAEESITVKDYYKFYASVRNGDVAAVDLYLSKGLDPNWKEEPFKTMPLLNKAINCHRDTLEPNQEIIIKKLLDAGIDTNATDLLRQDSPLIELTFCKESDSVNKVAQLIINKGADPKHVNNDKNSAFSSAISRDNESLALILLPLSNVDRKDIKRAVLNDMHVLVSRLIKQRYYLYDFDLIEWSVRHGFENVLIELLNAGVDPNSFSSPVKNYTFPILYAANLNQTNIVKILHQYGADINAVEKGLSVKDIAIKRKNTDLLLWLENLEIEGSK